MHACVAETTYVAEHAGPSLPPSIPPSHMQACLCGLLCTKPSRVQVALEPLSGSASTLPAWAVLCYAVLCLLSLPRGGEGGSVLSLTARLEYGLGDAWMRRQGEFSDPAADKAHATAVLSPSWDLL